MLEKQLEETVEARDEAARHANEAEEKVAELAREASDRAAVHEQEVVNAKHAASTACAGLA